MEERDIREAVRLAGRKAKEASRRMAAASSASKVRFLETLASLLEEREGELLAANGRDLEAARLAGLDAPRMDRLRLTPAVLADMAGACRYVASLPDPVGAMDSQWQRPNGLLVGRMRVPLGGGGHGVRGPAQRDGGRFHSLPQGGQCGDIARRIRGSSFQRGAGVGCCTRR